MKAGHMKHREYIIRECFPVGEIDICLMESKYAPKEYRTYLCPSEDMYTSMEESVFSTREAADKDYFGRCFEQIQKYEEKTGQPFPLPIYCFSVLKTTGDLIYLRRGMTGYYPCPLGKEGDRLGNEALAQEMNDLFGYTKAQIAAMEAGSMFGWNVPGADPSRYDEQGHYMPEPEKTEINDMEKGEER